MKRISASLAFVCLFLNGCSSLHSQVFQELKVGDSTAKLRETLGAPDVFAPSTKVEGAMAWYYTRRGEVCGFTVKEDTIVRLYCDASQGRGVGSAVLDGLSSVAGGVGQSLEKNSSAPVRTQCTPDQAGGMNCTSR